MEETHHQRQSISTTSMIGSLTHCTMCTNSITPVHQNHATVINRISVEKDEKNKTNRDSWEDVTTGQVITVIMSLLDSNVLHRTVISTQAQINDGSSIKSPIKLMAEYWQIKSDNRRLNVAICSSLLIHTRNIALLRLSKR